MTGGMGFVTNLTGLRGSDQREDSAIPELSGEMLPRLTHGFDFVPGDDDSGIEIARIAAFRFATAAETITGVFPETSDLPSRNATAGNAGDQRLVSVA